MAAGAVTTGFVEIPTQKLDAWLGKVKHGSTVAALSPSIPMKFGAGKSMTFDIGEAEYVGAGQNKGATEVTKSSQTVDPFKLVSVTSSGVVGALDLLAGLDGRVLDIPGRACSALRVESEPVLHDPTAGGLFYADGWVRFTSRPG